MAKDTRTPERTRKTRTPEPATPMGTEKKRSRTSEEFRDENPGAAEQLGEGVGGIGGTLAGAGIGSAAGPIGTIIGGIAGALGGWWAGEKIGRAAEDIGDHDEYYREHWQENRSEGLRYEDARVGYGVGHVAGRNPDWAGRDFESVEPKLRDAWTHERYDYDVMRPYVRAGYTRTYEEGKRS